MTTEPAPRSLTVMQAHVAADCPDRANCWARDLVSEYPGTIQNVNLPTPDSALVRLHRGDSTWLVSIARLEVSS